MYADIMTDALTSGIIPSTPYFRNGLPNFKFPEFKEPDFSKIDEYIKHENEIIDKYLYLGISSSIKYHDDNKLYGIYTTNKTNDELCSNRLTEFLWSINGIKIRHDGINLFPIHKFNMNYWECYTKDLDTWREIFIKHNKNCVAVKLCKKDCENNERISAMTPHDNEIPRCIYHILDNDQMYYELFDYIDNDDKYKYLLNIGIAAKAQDLLNKNEIFVESSVNNPVFFEFKDSCNLYNCEEFLSALSCNDTIEVLQSWCDYFKEMNQTINRNTIKHLPTVYRKFDVYCKLITNESFSNTMKSYLLKQMGYLYCLDLLN